MITDDGLIDIDCVNKQMIHEPSDVYVWHGNAQVNTVNTEAKLLTDKILWWDYIQVQRMNASTLVAGCRSMLSLHNRIKGGFQEETNAMRMGSGTHALLLEPQEFEKRFVVMPDFHLSENNYRKPKYKDEPLEDRRSDSKGTTYVENSVKDFVKHNPGKTIIGRTQYDQCLRAIESIRDRPKMRELVESSAKEVTVYGEICGVPCKGRLDLLSTQRIIGDLKNSASVHKRDFGRVFMRLRYDFKLAFYRDMVRQNIGDPKSVQLICQELSGDFDNALVEVPAIVLDNAWTKVVEVMTAYKHCLETNRWPGVDGGKDHYELEIPNWAMDGDEEFDWGGVDAVEVKGEL
jgi:exodeoxyribonuclease VIII